MIDEYENWDDSIRFTFIELADYMNKEANPLDTIIDFALSAGADKFWVHNAKDELRKLRDQTNKLVASTTEKIDLLLSVTKQLDLINQSIAKPVAYAKINDRGDLYDLRLQNNPYNNQSKVVPLYRINS